MGGWEGVGVGGGGGWEGVGVGGGGGWAVGAGGRWGRVGSRRRAKANIQT